MHVCDEYLGDLAYPEAGVAWTVRLLFKLTHGSLCTVDHWGRGSVAGAMSLAERREAGRGEGARKRDVLQREPSPSASTTRLEQFRDWEGPPPLVVPMKVTVMFWDMEAV